MAGWVWGVGRGQLCGHCALGACCWAAGGGVDVGAGVGASPAVLPPLPLHGVDGGPRPCADEAFRRPTAMESSADGFVAVAAAVVAVAIERAGGWGTRASRRCVHNMNANIYVAA